MMDKIAVLVHWPSWEAEEQSFELSEGISVCSTRNHPVFENYVKMCEMDGLDEGEPLNYKVMFLLDWDKESSPEWDSPYTTVSELCNIMAICTASPLGEIRLLSADDNSNYRMQTRTLYHEGPETDTLNHDFPKIDLLVLSKMQKCWQTCKSLTEGRMTNALSYYFYSWRVHFIQHTCINLSIVLESLFSPNTNSEVSHQIAFYASRFMGEDRLKRQAIYKSVKSFYSQRSRIVHGDMPNYEVMSKNTADMFASCSHLLEKLLLDHDLANRFNDKSKREKLLAEMLYG
jgi:hypothetical protein